MVSGHSEWTDDRRAYGRGKFILEAPGPLAGASRRLMKGEGQRLTVPKSTGVTHIQRRQAI